MVRTLFWVGLLSAAAGACLETPATGGLLTMALATVATAVAGLLARRRNGACGMAEPTVGGSLGALAVLGAAALAGRSVEAGTALMLWMAGGMGGMLGASLAAWPRGERT